MKDKNKNIEELLADKPELLFIIQILSEQSVIANKAKQSFSNLNNIEFIRLIKHHRLDSIFYKAAKEQNIILPQELNTKLSQLTKPLCIGNT